MKKRPPNSLQSSVLGVREGRVLVADVPERVTVCICTFRRSAVYDAVLSVANQIDVSAQLEQIVVIDNDETDALRPKMEELAQGLLVPLRYVHAPSKNISIARNAALDTVRTRWLAFLDDDEIASPTWLSELLSKRKDVEVVVGPSLARYSADMPRWVKRCDFHSSEIVKSASNAYSGNVLLDMDFSRLHAVRFLEELGRTGGEDTIFFRQLEQVGARFVYAPAAVVHEIVPASRANMRWVLRRMYRSGQTHGLACRKFDHNRYKMLWLTAAMKMGFSGLMIFATIPGSDRSRKWLARAAMHAGAVRYRFQSDVLEEYG